MRQLLAVCSLLLIVALVGGSTAVAQNEQGAVMLYAPRETIYPDSIHIGGFPYVFVGSGVAVSQSNMLTVWHVAELKGLVLRTGCCMDYQKTFSPFAPESGPTVEKAALSCPAPISILSVPNMAVPEPAARLAFRQVAVGESVVASGYPDGEYISLGLRVESYDTYTLNREVLRYMVWPPETSSISPAASAA
jgi:hypothetical protein